MGHYQNTFDQIHMSAACQARILEAASSTETQEEQTAMRKSKNVLKTMLLAAALATCLSAVAYASSNLLPSQLVQLSNVTLSSSDSSNYKVTKEESNEEVTLTIDGKIADKASKEAAANREEQNSFSSDSSNYKVTKQESNEEVTLTIEDKIADKESKAAAAVTGENEASK